MGFAIWTNHAFHPEARTVLERELQAAGHRLLASTQATPLVLAPGAEDPLLAEADIAFGQPDVGQTMAGSRLKLIELSSAGYTRYDREDFRSTMAARGVPVTNASQVFADPCAQHVLAQMLALERNLALQLRNQDGPRAWRYLEDRFGAGVLTDRTVLLLGFGAIGRRLAQLLAPFGGRVIAFRRAARGDEDVELATEAGLAAALGVADHVVNLLPEAKATAGFMSPGRFAQMKPGARFYNIGRGATVDQAALIAALASGQVGAAYLDVMEPEPLPPAHPLWAAPNCFITCHIGGGTGDQDIKLVRHFLGNLRRLENREPLIDRII